MSVHLLRSACGAPRTALGKDRNMAFLKEKSAPYEKDQRGFSDPWITAMLMSHESVDG